MTHQPTSHRLHLPDADVYYEVRGSGPLLLVIGQPMTSGPFGPLADALADEHTVITYDPRGVGRSSVADRAEDVTPELEADDLAAIVEAVGGGPADVFGSSGGAVAALALAVRHPGSVGTVIAHEPPLPELLPDAAHVRAAIDDVVARYGAAGSGAAWGGFVSLVMHDGPVGPDGVPPVSWPGTPAATAEHDAGAPHDGGPDAGPDTGHDAGPETSGDGAAGDPAADDEVFFLRMLRPFTRWTAPVDALRARGGVVVAVGEASRQEVAARSAEALASELGVTPVRFPGDHGGFMADPAGFAAAIRGLRARTA
ncbi:alpha/beta fold hydrolase [Cellulomonas aerilata]|uniref:Hydrolase n=1 Tax=Cellulomonas aerilata TaxID=515326 RepID=A0A512DBH8_9CELL|nr:alpha/beta hydrolase [Cellulomonas aerilata]GEO33834.1 hydrolase [Cellulomonas aerilata]